MDNTNYLNKIITAKIDRPIGSSHPKYPGQIYPVNYGYVPNTISGDGEELDCYVLGESKPLEEYTGKCIAIIHRLDEEDDKLIIVPKDKDFSNNQILALVNFQEKYFRSKIIRSLDYSENNKIKIEQIKSPEDILKFMNENIKYGWNDIYDNKHYDTMKNFRRIYKTMSIEETLKNGFGCCIEQVNLMHYLFDKLNIKNKMFCCRIYEPDNYNNLEEDEHMHCFILYYLNNKVYHLEHPNFKKIGIYEFDSEKEAINSIVNYYIELSGGIDRPTTEFYKVPTGFSFKEFNNYINNVENLKIYNIKDKQEYIEEIASLTKAEWGDINISPEEYKNSINNTINKIKNNLNNPNYCKLILLDKNNLVGFISIFEHDGDERPDLSPWYATMFVKKEYRGMGYSKILNNAIITEANKRGYSKLYLKSNLINYYEKFGAKYIEDLENGEKLYYIDLKN